MSSSKIVLEDFKVNGAFHTYAIGLNDQLVTIHSQQARAICLARLLSEGTPEVDRSSICIVGGGVSGLTFSLELLRAGWTDITILERLPDLMAVQNGCDTRWVHPHIIDWPDVGSDVDESHLGTLDWIASTASNVTYKMEKDWLQEVSSIVGSKTSQETISHKGRPERVISVHVGVTYINVSPYIGGVEVEWIRDSRVRPVGFAGSKGGNSGLERFSRLVLATGFGIESDVSSSYWRNENYGQLHIDGIQRISIVSGLGDGAISDLLRLTTKHFRPDRAIKEITQLNDIHEKLQEIKLKVRSEDNFDLLGALNKFSARRKGVTDSWKGILKYFNDNRREDTRVILYSYKGEGFCSMFNGSPASFLNKFFLFVLYKSGAFQYIDSNSGELESVARIYSISQEGVIRRHGVNKVEMVRKFLKTTGDISFNPQPYDRCMAYLLDARKREEERLLIEGAGGGVMSEVMQALFDDVNS